MLPIGSEFLVGTGAVDLPEVNEAKDVWMLQVGDRPDLAEKPVAPGHGHQFGPQNLDRDLAGVT
jgi:hypothetical protein